MRDAKLLLPQRTGVLREEIDLSPRLGTIAGPLPKAQGPRRTTRPRERSALARALQPTGLRLAYEDQRDAQERDGAGGDRREVEPETGTEAPWHAHHQVPYPQR